SYLSRTESFPTRRSSDLAYQRLTRPESSTVGNRNTRVTKTATTSPDTKASTVNCPHSSIHSTMSQARNGSCTRRSWRKLRRVSRSEEHTSELQSRENLVC